MNDWLLKLVASSSEEHKIEEVQKGLGQVTLRDLSKLFVDKMMSEINGELDTVADDELDEDRSAGAATAYSFIHEELFDVVKTGLASEIKRCPECSEEILEKIWNDNVDSIVDSEIKSLGLEQYF